MHAFSSGVNTHTVQAREVAIDYNLVERLNILLIEQYFQERVQL